MSYRGLIWKSGTRNKRRVVLTIISVAMVMFVQSNLATFVTQFDRGLEEANPRRLLTRHSVSITNFLPARHRQQIEKVPGVVAVTPLTYFGGIYIDRSHTDFSQFACDPQTFFEVYPELNISGEQQQSFVRERGAVIVGRQKAEKHGWKPGDRITLKGSIFPVDLELTIRGIFSGTSVQGEGAIYFHHDYLEEAIDDTGFAGFYSMRVDSTESAPGVIKSVDAIFRNTNAPTRTETEQSFRMSMLSMLGNLKLLIATISIVILFTLLLVTANTMAMSVRERTGEVAILKSLGFRRSRVLMLLAGEGIMMTLIGGLVGCAMARLLSVFVDMPALTQGFLQRFDVPWSVTALGLFISILVGLVSTIIPAFNSARLTVADGLRHVG